MKGSSQMNVRIKTIQGRNAISEEKNFIVLL